MNSEVVSELNELKSKLKGFLQDYSSKEQRVTEIQIGTDNLEFERDELNNKLSDINNYQVDNDLSMESTYTDAIDDAEKRISFLEVFVSLYEDEIKKYNEEVEKLDVLIVQDNKDIAKLGEEYRRLGDNITPEQDRVITKSLEEKRQSSKDREFYLYSINRDQKVADDNAAELKLLQNNVAEYTNLLNSIPKTVPDLDAYKADEEKLAAIEAEISALNNEKALLGNGVIDNIDELINKAGSMSKEELLSKLSEIEEKINLANIDTKEAMENEMLANIDAIDNTTIEIGVLEAKLSDPKNYETQTIDAFKQEMYESKVKELELELKRLVVDEKTYKKEVAKQKKNISASNKSKVVYEADLNRLFKERLTNGSNVLPEKMAELDFKINAASYSINTCISVKALYEINRDEAIANLNETTSKKQKTEEMLSRYKTLLSGVIKTDDVAVDKHQMNMDKDRLDSLKSGLEALKNRQEYLSYDPSKKIKDVIGKVNNEVVKEDVKEETPINPAREFEIIRVDKPNEEEIKNTRSKINFGRVKKFLKKIIDGILTTIVMIASAFVAGVKAGNVYYDIDDKYFTDDKDKYTMRDLKDEIEARKSVGLGSIIQLEKGSTIHETSDFGGKSGVIKEGHPFANQDLLINTATYRDSSTDEDRTFNLIDENGKFSDTEKFEYDTYMMNHKHSVLTGFHVTPCDKSGKPIYSNNLGGYTHLDESTVKGIDNRREALGVDFVYPEKETLENKNEPIIVPEEEIARVK